MPDRVVVIVSRALSLVLLLAVTGFADDWPMWRYDAGRTAASPHDLPDALHLQWTRSYSPRKQAWDDPLNNDLMQYDRVFEPIVADGRLFLGFNDSDKLVALDLASGEELWRYYADGPVRFSPVAWRDHIYFCSDDGHLYCLEAATGQLTWKFRGGPSARKVLGNQRVISLWPARGGPVIRDGTLYFAASIWPFMGTFVYALDPVDGNVRWVNDGTGANYIKQPHSAPSFGGVAPQGALVATGETLLVPGGRSVPAAFDAQTGELRYFHLNAGGKGTGGSLVMADEEHYFVHTRLRGVRQFNLADGAKGAFTCNEPVLFDGGLVTATDSSVTALGREIRETNAEGKEVVRRPVLWEVEADGSGDLIRAGNRLYAAGGQAVVAIAPPAGETPARVVWSAPVAGNVQRLVAGGKSLVGVTLDGQIHCFGPGQPAAPRRLGNDPVDPSLSETAKTVSETAKTRARQVLAEVADDGGYALCFGAEDRQLIEALVVESKLRIVVVEADPARVADLRRRWDTAGWYGGRITVHQGDVGSFQAPAYIAHLVLVSPRAAATDDSAALAGWYRSVRPYGGVLQFWNWESETAALAEQVRSAGLEQAVLRPAAAGLVVERSGALPGSAPWTHLYGNIANTVKSDDQRVRLPLGVLWFGGSSNMDVLPRHGHGPPEQVIGGRQFIQGVNSLSARDVYTGRVLWIREFEDLGTYQVYYDETYKNTPLDPAYNQVHIPGANARGTNYVATEDGLYLVIGSRCLVLDNRTGRTRREIPLPPRADGSHPGKWAFLGVYGDLLLAGTGYANFTQRLEGVQFDAAKKRGNAWHFDWFASLGLIAMDRHTGEVRWQIDSRHSFLHNGIVAGGGRIYLLDKLPQSVESQLVRRGRDTPGDYRLMAVDAASGEVLWENVEATFGTWLGYSAQHDLLLHAGAAAPDRSTEEVDQGLLACRGSDGQIVWQQREAKYAGPCILHNDFVLTNAASYQTTAGVFRLTDGTPVLIDNPLTGQQEPWKFTRAYGCNTAIASEHLLTFRSGAAGYYDLAAKCGVGNLGGFRSGCSSNLIAADGVLNAPDYTRTCSCGYQNQTSLGLVHMPEIETWTVSQFFALNSRDRLSHFGVNLGAPGDRRADDDTLWLEHPLHSGEASPLTVDVAGEGLKFFRRHSSAASGPGWNWVAASGAENVRTVAISLAPQLPADQQAEIADAAEAHGETARYTVRLHFCEPGIAGPGQRVFDVALQGRTVATGLDVAREAGGPWQSLVKEFVAVADGDAPLRIEFTPRGEGGRGAILSGVEVQAE